MSIRIPILMYHGIAGGADVVPSDWSRRHTVAWVEFAAQAGLLRREGWHCRLPRELIGSEAAAAGQPDLAITFDDGHASDRRAADLLADAGLKAAFYITWSHLGRQGYLAKDEVARIAALGFSIGAHGLTHIPFTSLNDDRLARDLSVSRRRLEDLIGTEVTDLACPFGAYDRRVVAAAREAGYRTIMTSDFGRAAIGRGNVFARLPVFSDTPLEDFHALLHEGCLGTVRRRIMSGMARRGRAWNVFASRRRETRQRQGVTDWR